MKDDYITVHIVVRATTTYIVTSTNHTMAATCCAAGAVTVTATASVYRSSSMKNNNAAVVGAPSTSARVAVAPSRGLVRAAAVAEAIADKEVSLADSLRPTSADCARTLVEIANTGTISTTCEDGEDWNGPLFFIFSSLSHRP